MDQGGPLPDTPFVGLVSGMDAPLLPLDLPKGLKGQARERVAARQISGSSGDKLDHMELHPFAAKPHVTPWTHVIVAATDHVAKWREHFNGSASECLAILPDYLTLPAAKDIWTIDVKEDIVCARLGLEDGFSCSTELATVMLSKAVPPKAVLRLGNAFAPIDDLLIGLGVKVLKDPQEFKAASLPMPQRFSHDELLFDLGKDPKAAFDTMAHTIRLWRTPVILALIALLLWTVSVGITLRDINKKTRDVRVQTVADARHSLIPTGPVLDIRAQVTQALSARKSMASAAARNILPLDLLKTAAAIIHNTQGTLSTAAFAPSSGLMITLILPDFAALDHLTSALEDAKISVRIEQSSSADTGGVEAVLRLETKGGGQ